MVRLVEKMSAMEDRVCHCGEQSDRLLDLSYGEPQMTPGSSSSASFHSGMSSSAIPIPMVLGLTQTLFLPEDHPLLQMVDLLFLVSKLVKKKV